MIHVCQGHEKGVGTEVFLKSLLRLPSAVTNSIKFHGNESVLQENLKFLNVPFLVENDHFIIGGKSISFKSVNKNKTTLSTESLLSALKNIKSKDVLVTLPTSKDQLISGNTQRAGYTEFFRHHFNKNDICMVFKGPRDLVLLITDHIPLKNISQTITKEFLLTKLKVFLNHYPQYFHSIDEVLLAGLNPHAGEGGILGNEENTLKEFFSNKDVVVKGNSFLPGDTLHFHRDPKKNQLFVYLYHDQGLINFKDRNGLMGINISLGLPFLRMSVDHGTAFEIYGKNKADCIGCYHVLTEAYKVIKHVDQ